MYICIYTNIYIGKEIFIRQIQVYVQATHALLMDRRLPAVMRIRYKEEKFQLKQRMPTRLKYLMRPELRREADGSIIRVWQHAVLLPYKDKPVLAPRSQCIRVRYNIILVLLTSESFPVQINFGLELDMLHLLLILGSPSHDTRWHQSPRLHEKYTKQRAPLLHTI